MKGKGDEIQAGIVVAGANECSVLDSSLLLELTV